MKINRRVFVSAAIGCCLSGPFAFAASPSGASPDEVIAAAAEADKLVYVFFHRGKDPRTDAMFGAIKGVVGQYPDHSTWASVQLTDAAGKDIAERYQVTRAPMPLVLALHPNGAVIGVYPTKVSESQLVECFVTHTQAECLKQLQEQRMVLLCLQSSPDAKLPRGVTQFTKDPHYASRCQIVTLQVSDPDEAAFLEKLEIDPSRADGTTVFFAPPGVLVGKYAANVTKDKLSSELAAAGKCCDDENCKHNKAKAKKTAGSGQ